MCRGSEKVEKHWSTLYEEAIHAMFNKPKIYRFYSRLKKLMFIEKKKYTVASQLWPRLQGNGSVWNSTGLAFTRELMAPFQREPLAIPKRVHLESRSRMEPNQKLSHKHPEPFSSGTLGNDARGNSAVDN